MVTILTVRLKQGIYQKWQQHTVPGPCGHIIKGPQGTLRSETLRSFSLTDSNQPPNSVLPFLAQNSTPPPFSLQHPKIKGKPRETILIKMIVAYFLDSKVKVKVKSLSRVQLFVTHGL